MEAKTLERAIHIRAELLTLEWKLEELCAEKWAEQHASYDLAQAPEQELVDIFEEHRRKVVAFFESKLAQLRSEFRRL